MSHKKSKRRNDADKRIEELRGRIEKLIERTKRMDIELRSRERELLKSNVFRRRND